MDSNSRAAIKLGLIGTGRIGRLHADNLSRRIQDADLAMIVDADGASAADCARSVHVAAVGTDYRKILESPDIEAVVVCSSTDTHTPIIIDAAAAGKHIFCEKPIDTELDRIDRALDAVRRAGVLLQIGFNRRFDPNFLRVRESVAGGEIGTPHHLHIISRDPAPPPLEYIKKSGGLFLDMAIHDFDMARYLIGAEVDEIYATGGVRVDPAIGEAGDLDTALSVLKFSNGVVGVIENCRQAVYGYDQRVEVFGSGGAIRIDNNHSNTAVLSGRECVRRDLPLHFFMERYVESYLAEMRAFLQAIRTGGPSPVSGEEARVPVVMAKAARLSWETNRPIRLSEIGASMTHPGR